MEFRVYAVPDRLKAEQKVLVTLVVTTLVAGTAAYVVHCRHVSPLQAEAEIRVNRDWRASDGAKLGMEKKGDYVTARLDKLTDYDIVVFDLAK